MEQLTNTGKKTQKKYQMQIKCWYKFNEINKKC